MVNWPEFLYAYGLTIVSWVVLTSIVALPNYTFPAAVAQAFFLLCWSYGGHVLAHMVSTQFPLNYLNLHVSLHHDHYVDIPRWLNLLLETGVNFMGFFIFILLQHLFDVHILSTTMILAASFLYILIHIADFSIFGNEQHAEHHTRTFCNYDPEFFDTLFKTRCSPEKPYRQLSGEILYACIACIAALFLKHRYQLD